MSIRLYDCVAIPDGTTVCYDRNRGEYYEVSKRKLSLDEVSKEDMMALIELLSDEPRTRDLGKI